MPELPDSTVAEAERLTRLALRASDPDEAAAYRDERDALLAEAGYAARERGDDGGVTLVCYPESWLDETGTIRMDAFDPDEAVERPLGGPGDPDEWDEVATHNRGIARAVHEAHGSVHGETVTSLADFASNHYAKRIEDLTREELAEFREEYLVRNAWPTEAQLERLADSLRYAFAVVDEEKP
ncbi:hypothetical protein J2752_002076 [Halarchaeum rubridurum]|uniref:RnhA operon protein n=1 Tax=Halarchaeum rubridurum TaxID=489911 RepID=A0A830G009_9EURY|nr:rnhA operon protein [Halarchaeum rubridurum]MBP1955164.1 hypothetical protein [Halarchaeum rubridurum]GGM68441.1 hypothetical protein GCM10009017_18310 [Halarchaeum rubridurum]